ncbi:MAG: hypothetical protein DCC65_08985 [Planctomycetota bacterium]|nr:MAG: hypothetical protein DCC65_08985 [Planctomycetota bacterium]
MVLCAVALAPPMGLAFWQLFLHLYGPPTRAATWSVLASAHGAESAPGDPWDARQFVIDDAGRCCRRAELARVELRVSSDAIDFIGHAFVSTPARTVGFRTHHESDIGLVDYLSPFAKSRPGFLRDDSAAAFDYVVSYSACPETLRMLEESIDRHAHDPYQVGDWDGGFNCATWAQKRLRDAGLTPPPGKCPNQLARSMYPRPPMVDGHGSETESSNEVRK